MKTWVIDKQFSFCYGHRVWSQKLNNDFCEYNDYACKCRHLHGHEGLAHVFLEGQDLERGMVTDFKHLGWLKNFLDKYVDHRFIIDKNDPMFSYMVGELWNKYAKQELELVPVFVPGTIELAGYELDMSLLKYKQETPEYETLEGYFIVDFVPTSENLSKWLYDVAQAKMSMLNIKVSQIDWFETPKSRSSYRA